MPYELINHSPIYIKTNAKKGWIKQNLLDYLIILNKDFFVSLEPIERWSKNEKNNSPTTHLIISGKPNNKAITFTKLQSFGTWRKDNIEFDYYLIAK